jgi:DNA-directed RNA polymerase alpha subunit
LSIITPESKIEELRLSEHAADCVKNAGIVYVCDLLRGAGAELRLFCDQPAFDEIKRRLAEAGLEIGGDLE